MNVVCEKMTPRRLSSGSLTPISDALEPLKRILVQAAYSDWSAKKTKKKWLKGQDKRKSHDLTDRAAVYSGRMKELLEDTRLHVPFVLAQVEALELQMNSQTLDDYSVDKASQTNDQYKVDETACNLSDQVDVCLQTTALNADASSQCSSNVDSMSVSVQTTCHFGEDVASQCENTQSLVSVGVETELYVESQGVQTNFSCTSIGMQSDNLSCTSRLVQTEAFIGVPQRVQTDNSLHVHKCVQTDNDGLSVYSARNTHKEMSMIPTEGCSQTRLKRSPSSKIPVLSPKHLQVCDVNLQSLESITKQENSTNNTPQQLKCISDQKLCNTNCTPQSNVQDSTTPNSASGSRIKSQIPIRASPNSIAVKSSEKSPELALRNDFSCSVPNCSSLRFNNAVLVPRKSKSQPRLQPLGIKAMDSASKSQLEKKQFPSSFGKVCLEVIKFHLQCKPVSAIRSTAPSQRIQKELFEMLDTKMDVQTIWSFIQTVNECASRSVLNYILNLNDSKGNIPLHLAIIRRNFDVMSLLIASCPKTVDHQNEAKETPLILAVQAGNLSAVEKLVMFGADLDKKDKEGKTAIQHAADLCFYPIVNYLLNIKKYLES